MSEARQLVDMERLIEENALRLREVKWPTGNHSRNRAHERPGEWVQVGRLGVHAYQQHACTDTSPPHFGEDSC